MKIEISEDELTYRLVDGEEDTPGYVTSPIAELGEPAILEKDGEDEPWIALVDENGECDGRATQGNKSVPVGFELGCELPDDDEDEEEETIG